MTDPLHIVALDAPSPPNYGGACEIYFKVVALAKLGRPIILHYFGYKPDRDAHGLETYCREIHAYPRSSFLRAFLKQQSFITASRVNRTLIDRLNADPFPVLLDGIHCTGLIPHLRKDKSVSIRIHNDEAAYYHQLSLSEPRWMKRLYLQREARLLQKAQSSLSKNIPALALSTRDAQAFKQQYEWEQVHFLPCFLPWQKLVGSEGSGTYCLYHGNLAISENREAVRWLIGSVFRNLEVPLVVAGHCAAELAETLKHPKGVSFIDAPNDETLNDLIHNAHIHILPSMNTTGVKLKLLHVLLEGRFCITNQAGVEGSGIDRGVTIADGAEDTRVAVLRLMNTAFTRADVEERIGILDLYDNQKNAAALNERL